MTMDAFMDGLIDIVITLLYILAIVVPVLVFVAYLTYMERRVIGGMQMRKGPAVVGPFGLLQPFADGLKLFGKETIIPSGANKVLFIVGPSIIFILSLVGWAVIPFDKTWVLVDLDIGVLYLLAVSSLGVYGVLIAGWASNSKYAFLGALRSSAQMISYEIALGIIVVSVLIWSGSTNLNDIVMAQEHVWFALPLLPMFVIFFISVLAETNRAPFDLPEGESELVAGFFVEYSSMPFALFFLGEYSNILLMSALTVILFLGGWLAPIGILPFTLIPGVVWFILKIIAVAFVFLWVRASFPRYRYDQLMALGWKVFLPLSLIWVAVTAGIKVYS